MDSLLDDRIAWLSSLGKCFDRKEFGKFSDEKNTQIRIPKSKSIEIEKIKTKMEGFLSDDNTLNVAALTSLLKDIMK
ncbi:MAG: hypothetical protein IPO37_21515 [Saprospiraceae bacterium]|nr:hypothetical protein [Saprospiraceae bacterium]